jgi:large subunit ribosomal protein L10
VLTKEEKREMVEELHDKFTRVKAVFLTDFTGLPVETLTRLRKQLKEQGMEYRVVKNTLLRMASQKTPVEALVPYFVGPNGVVLAYDDPMVPARVLMDFIKEEPELDIKVALVEGKVLGVEEIKALANLPPKPILIAQLIGMIKAPVARLMFVLSAPISQLLGVFEAIKEKKQK